MTLSVTRRMLAKRTAGDVWEKLDFDTTVWNMDTETGEVEVPYQIERHDYYSGILTCYINGKKVDVNEFDNALPRGWTRGRILESIS